MSIFALLNQIKDDEIVLPGIQRDFVWDENQIVRLLDSIMRGYPIGIVLLWETFNDIQFRHFLKDYKSDNLLAYSENTRKRKLKLVLDGQQRLQSLFIALYGTYDGRVLYFDILSGKASDDVSEEVFWFYFGSPSDGKEWNDEVIRDLAKLEGERPRDFTVARYEKVSDLFAMGPKERKELIRALRKSLQFSEEDETRIDVNLSQFDVSLSKDQNILRVLVVDENLPSDSPTRKSEADVLEIFVRINQGGTPLNRADLIFSMLKLNWKESSEGLPQFVKALNQGHSLDLDADFVVRCLLAVSDLGAKFDLNILRKKSNVAALRQNFEKCCNAIRAAVDFVVQDCRCLSSELLGSRNILVLFVYYLFHQPKHQIANRDIQAAKKALLYFAFSRVLSRWGDSRITAFIKWELKPRAANGQREFPLEAALQWIEKWNGEATLSIDFLQSNIKLALHLIQGLSGSKVQYTRNSPEIDHIFPAAGLRREKVDERYIHNLANFWILPQSKNRSKSDEDPAIYFKDVPDAELDRALIDRSLLSYPRFRKFLDKRAEEMLVKMTPLLGMDAKCDEFAAGAKSADTH